MDTTRIVLVRHAHVTDNSEGADARLCGWFDPPLSPHGQAQAVKLCRLLAGESAFAGITSSPLRRAHATASCVGETLGLTPIIEPDLREINCGSVDGLRLSGLKATHPDLWARNLAQTDETFRWPDGESYREFRTRALGAIARIGRRYAGQRVLVVTHAGIISQVIGSLAGTSPASWSRFRVQNASITEINWSEHGTTVVRFDDLEHLRDLGAPARVGPTQDA